MKGELNNENGITKTEWLSKRITKELGQSKSIDKYSKRSYEEAVWQEKKKSIRIEGWRQHVAGSQKYLLKTTLKETRPKEIQIF